MADDVRRPPGENAPSLQTSAARARNRTMVMGSDSVGQMRSQFEADDAGQSDAWNASSQPSQDDSFRANPVPDPQDPLGLESAEYHDPVAEERTLQALDEIFDLGGIDSAPAAPHSDIESEHVLESSMELPQEPEPELPMLTEIIQPPPISVARIVRPGGIATSQTPSAPPASTVFVPPAATAAPLATLSETKPSRGDVVSDKQEEIFWKAEGPLVGFLVSFDHDPRGAYVELRTGRLIVSSQREESGNCLVIRDASVSPMHAIMRVAPGGIVQVLDQLSESGTRVKHLGQHEEVFLSGEKATVAHGDIVFFGDRKFHVLLVVGDGE